MSMFDLECHLCSCSKWIISSLPCVHVFHCITASELDISDYVEDYFTSFAYDSINIHLLYPIPNGDIPIVLPS